MSHDDPRYADINNVQWPPCSRIEARRAYLALLIHFGRAKDAPVGLHTDNMRSSAYIESCRGGARTCWVSAKPTRGVAKGWPRLLHDVSHYVHRYRHPSQKPHGPSHAAIERSVMLFAIAQGWDTGRLAPKVKPKPTTWDKRAVRLERIEASITRWESKAKRAANALKKLKRQRAAIVRVVVKCPVQ